MQPQSQHLLIAGQGTARPPVSIHHGVRNGISFTKDLFKENLPGVPTQPTFKAPRPRGAPAPLPNAHKITPRSRSSGRPIPREVSHSSLTCPHPLTPQVTDKSDDSLQLVHSVQVGKGSEQPRGPRLPLQSRLCRAAECRLHEAPLRWQEAAGTSHGPRVLKCNPQWVRVTW